MLDTSERLQVPITEHFDDASLESLVDAIRQGSEAAANELYGRYSRGLRWFLQGKTGRPEVDDEIQEVFATVFAAIRADTIKDPRCLSGYIRTVAVRVAAGSVGSFVRERNTSVCLDDSYGDRSVPCPRQTPDQRLLENERIASARRAIDALSGGDRELLVRFYFHEQTKEQICREMELTETQFRLRKSRIKSRVVTEIQRKEASTSLERMATRVGLLLAS